MSYSPAFKTEVAEGPSMTVAQTLTFLAEHSVLPFPHWESGLPFLYVFDDVFTLSDFKRLSILRKPNVARVDHATRINVGFGTVLSEGQVDYYSIDPNTQKIRRVKVSDHSRKSAPFAVLSKYFFMPDDKLFPRSPLPE